MSPLPASARPARLRRTAAWASSVALCASLALTGVAALPAAAASTTAYTGIILGVGANETQRIVTWYSSDDSAQVVQLAPTSAVVGDVFPAAATSFGASGTANVAGTTPGFNRHSTVTGLAENTSYSYRVGSEGNWSPVYTFATQSFEGNFDFLFYGDPQIGASGNVAADGAGWADTLNVSLTANPKAELLVSGGDQVETANTESQWDAFLAPSQLKNVPWVATIGNHDVGGKAYEQHLYTPNTDRAAAYYADGSKTASTSGGDYWFIYKDVLFIDLNSNSYKTAANGSGGDDAHVQYVTDVINAHGTQAKYTVLVYHHSIYSSAAHAKDADAKVRRVDFPTTFSNLGVDLVLQGHDHVYTRSYEIKNGAKANPAEQPGANEVFTGPGGVVYVTANSASGSKYYDMTAPDSTGTSGAGNGADPQNPGNYWYNSVQNQDYVRSYVKVGVQKDALVVENLTSGTCAAPNAGGGKCTTTNGVGTTQDKVTIRPYHGNGQEIQVDVPNAPVGEFGWTIDGQNGLVDMGTATLAGDNTFTASGKINQIAVTDSRRTLAPWSISASVSDFTDGDKTFSGKYLGWTPKVVTPGAGATAGAAVAPGTDTGAGLSVSRPLGTAVQGHPRGTGVLGADLSLKLPDTVDQGTYRSTLTITALAG
ncbi:fibronectin type III domain-containing protein [Microbacterium sp. CJ88]|uniref:fibronectin type III domain-containing protein n=1 Tax=Microbacterium sp. CJ88 TaxID=3445672 RepID=UPI003F658BB3